MVGPALAGIGLAYMFEGQVSEMIEDGRLGSVTGTQARQSYYD
jgi:hypothetical protein